jgi:hypothetical protein
MEFDTSAHLFPCFKVNGKVTHMGACAEAMPGVSGACCSLEGDVAEAYFAAKITRGMADGYTYITLPSGETIVLNTWFNWNDEAMASVEICRDGQSVDYELSKGGTLTVTATGEKYEQM